MFCKPSIFIRHGVWLSNIGLQGTGSPSLITYHALAAKILYLSIFTALHAMQTLSSDENSVCLSVGLSVCQTRDL